MKSEINKKRKKELIRVVKKENFYNRRKEVIVILLIFIFSLGERLFFLQGNIDKDFPYSIFYYGDSMKYDAYAVAILKGKLYDNGFPYHPPFFAWLLALIYKIIGIPTGSGYPYKIIFSCINSAACILVYILVKEFFNRSLAIIISLAFSLSFGMLVLSATANNENIYLIILIITLILALKNRELNSYKYAVLLGILFGIGSLTRAEHLVLLPFFILYFYLNKNLDIWKAMKYYIILVLSTFLVIMPWFIRNYIILTRYNRSISFMRLEPLNPFVLITNYGPINFAMANNDYSDGGFNRNILDTKTGSSTLNLLNPQHRYYFIHGYEEGMKWIIENPIKYIKLCIKKLNISSDALSLGFTSWNFPSGLDGIRRAVDVFAPERNWFKYPMILLSFCGFFILLINNWRRNLIMHFILLHKLIIIILFFGYVRQLLSIYPILLIFIFTSISLLKERKLKVIMIIGIIISLFAFIYDGFTVRKPKNYTAKGSVDSYTGYLIQDATIYLKLIRKQ